MRKYSLLFIVVSICFNVFSQASLKHTDILKMYYEAKEQIAYERYAIAYPIIQDFLKNYENNVLKIDPSIVSESYFYKALCAKETKAPEAQTLLIDYIEDYPGTTHINTARFLLGEIAYDIPNYQNAIEYFKEVNEKELSKNQALDYNYKYAFALFATKKFKEARARFNTLTASDSKYKEDAFYYSGLSSYYLGDYNNAYKTFQKIETAKKYDKIVPYYLASIQFVNKDYKGVVAYAEPKLKENVKYTTEIAHLLGNSYYELQQYDKAKYYLEEYMSKSVKATPEDYYILGYVQAQENDCKNAVKNLGELSPLETELAQNAMYQMAKCLIKIDKKNDAKNAFLQSARLDFNKAIKEESIFQYAKLSYELNNINDALVTLKKFIVDYPKSIYYNEANELLADIFLITKNYDEAIAIIESLPNVSPKLQATYQQMAYLKALSLYNDKNYAQAIPFFNKSLKYTSNKSYEALTYYWKADIAHQSGDYTQSKQLLDKFFSLSKNINTAENIMVSNGTANYLQGYNYYKEKNYPQAVVNFSAALNQLKDSKTTSIAQNIYPDALVRLADAYFIQKKYQDAKQNYDVVIKNNFKAADYALFQNAIIDGLEGKYLDKIAGMNALVARFPKSSFADEALFQAGNTQFAISKTNDAKQTFNTLLKNYPKSTRVPDTYNKLGLIAYNQDSYDEALSWYQKVVDKYPNTPAANEAMLVIKDIYIDKGDANGFIKYASKNSSSNLTASAQDSIIYLTAESQFQKGNIKQALDGFDSYLLQYPKGFFNLQARFYRAECNYSLQSFDKALQDYVYVANLPQNRFSERSVARSANIFYFDQKNYKEALNYYSKLEQIATLDENKRESLIGLMRTNFKLNNHTSTLVYTDKVSELSNLPEFYKREITYYKGVTYFKQQDYDKALPQLQTIATTLDNEQSAEAQYDIAKIYFEKKNYKQAESEAMKYTENFPAYEYYLGKTYILLSDIYKVNGKILQAKATLQSLIDNYSFDDDVMKEAKEKLQIIIDQETQNSNLKLPDNNLQILQFDK
ncbi:MAG TPA: tetratricopeptide repeat protein [Chitinophagales bacterium]|nr:tetratricopeptide repeat protein [Chitinophagales bacterium]HND45766.1 tetratricopeptide repeat protein [Chitinophagales bacterium]HNG09285.1 tetratricopeptide repeat protein [Chitinophagales bacterium]HNG27730.1 tetratricopeptide repeat protein [Chitinophagales bacterium]